MLIGVVTACHVTELKQDQEVAKEPTTSELQRTDDSVAATADSGVVVAMAASEDSQQKLEETCEQFLRQLKEARRDVGRPEDLRVNWQRVLF